MKNANTPIIVIMPHTSLSVSNEDARVTNKKPGMAKMGRNIIVVISKQGNETKEVIVTFFESCFFPSKNKINAMMIVIPSNSR